MFKKMLIVSLSLALFGAGCVASTPVTRSPDAQSTISSEDFHATFSSEPFTSPYVIHGAAKGPWYFEAVFPVKVLNSVGQEIGGGQARADSDWMTEDFVPFTATIEFPTQPVGSIGSLVFHNDNPSGDPARDKSMTTQVVFGQ